MRRLQRYLSAILSARRVHTTNAIGEKIEGWENPTEARASVFPMGDGVSAELYGERATNMRRIVIDKPISIEVNSGVWLPGETDKEPPWRIVSVQTWPNHTEATLEKRVM